MKQNCNLPVVASHKRLGFPVGDELTSRPSTLNSLSGHSAAATDQPSTLAPSTIPPIHQSIDPGLINPGLRLGVALLLLALAGFSVRGAEPQTLHGHVPPGLQSLTPTGRLPGTNRLNLAIGLPLRNAASLSNLLQQIYDPASPQYHHYLTPAEFTSKFGPTEEDYQAVIAFARANHLRVTTTHPNRLLLDVSGSVAEVEQALHLTLHTYRHPTENRTFYAPDREPSLDLSVPVLHISGLDNYVLPRPASHKMTFPTPNATPATGSGPSGSYMGKDFRVAYVPGVSLTGAGQSVGLLQFDSGFEQSNITSYETQAGLPNVPVQAVLLDGYGGGPGEANDEVSLDIEMVISMAPGVSQIDVFEGEITDDILNAMAASNQVRQLSASWSYPIDATTVQIFQQFAAQGQSFFNASGDYDAWVGSIYPPCDNPYITIVGGTTLTMNGTGGSYESETAWNRDNGIGSGGGISTQYPIPSWQTNISMAANQGSTTMRNIPDVAMTAEDVWVICANGGTGAYGGTSCATPLWAGFAALVNQQAASTGQPPIGFINPAVYAIGTGSNYAACFHDTTTGNNESPSSPTKFSAVAGYDLCTGWGTPAGQNLINALANPEPLLITPTSGFSAIGGVGGPFFPVTSQNYSLTNSGTNSLTWTLSNTSAWLNVSSSGGTLAPGGPATLVTVSLNSAASNLVVGSYGSTIWITNQNDQIGQSRQFALSVISPPGITQQPVNQAVLEGAAAAFSVQATGGLPLVYQWQCNGTNLTDGGNILGSASTNLTISDVSAANVGSYTVVVTNFAGTATSSNAELTIVPSPPVIITQPASQSVFAGNNVQLTVAAVGTTPFSYQWTLDTTNINGATNATLTLSDVQASQSGNYSVLVTNVYGATNSATATLTVLPCEPSPGGLISWWQAEGNAGDSISGNNGVAIGGVSYGSGEVGQAFDFDGTSGYVNVPSNPNLEFTNAFTVEGWINLNTAPGSGTVTIAAKGLDSNAGMDWMLSIGHGQLETAATVGGSQQGGYCATTLATGAWYHVAMSFDGSNLRGYVNGALDGTFAVSGTAQATTNALRIGAYAPVNGAAVNKAFFPGKVDELSVYDQTLSASEIQAIYAAGSDGKCFTPVSPTIMAQPTNQTVNGGDTATFAVAASGTPLLSYQWSLNATNLAGATNATLTLADVQPANGGAYAVTVSNAYGSAVSSNAVLTVLVFPPTITTQPTSQSANVGNAAIFAVTAGGTPPLSYQWSFGTTNLAGATNATLTLTNVQLTQAGNYSVVVSNLYGSTNSAVAVLNVNPAPPCDPPPSGLVSWWRAEGNANDFVSGNNGVVTGGVSYASGEVGLAFAFDGTSGYVNVPSSPNLMFTNAFTVEGWINLNTVPAGTVTIAAKGLDSNAGMDWMLSVANGQLEAAATVGGSQQGGYCATTLVAGAWYHVAMSFDGSNLRGYVNGALDGTFAVSGTARTTTNALRIGAYAPVNGTAANQAFFPGKVDELSVYNQTLSASEIQAIYAAGNGGKCINPVLPTITTQPTNQTVYAGNAALFTVAAGGTPPLSYQWSCGTTNLNGATNATLLLSNVQVNLSGSYYSVLVSNLYGATNSVAAILTVNPALLCDPPPSGLVSWWRAEGNANDIISGNNGVGTGGVSYASGEVGLAFDFDGTSGYVNVPSSPNLEFTNAFTVEGWINLNTAPGSGTLTIAAKGLDSNAGMDWMLSVGHGQLETAATVGGSQQGGYCATTLVAGAWYHVAMSFDGSNLRGYVNGALDGTFAVSGTARTTTNALRIGAYAPVNGTGGNKAFFPGKVDELSVYNQTLSASEIQAIYTAGTGGKCFTPVAPTLTTQPTNQTVYAGNTAIFTVVAVGTPPLSYQWSIGTTNLGGATNATLTLTNVQLTQAGNYSVLVSNLYGATNSATALLTVNPAPPCDPPPSGLVSWWRAEGNANDFIGGNNGAVTGGVSYASGEVGLAFEFDGTSGYVNVPSSPNLMFSNAFTVEGWINLNTVPAGTVTIAAKGLDSNAGMDWMLSVANGQLEAAATAGGSQQGGYCATTLVAGAWYHVAMSFDGSNLRGYVNGALDGTFAVSGTLRATTNALRIGAYAPVNGTAANEAFFPGKVDELSVYNQTLSASEIQAIYAAGTGGKCNNPVSPTITTQPTNQTVNAGSAATFTVVAVGTEPLNYQWSFNTTNLVGATNATFTLANVQPANAGAYAVTVSNAYGSVVSSNALLTVLVFPPTITTQPASQSANVGNTAVFTVVAGGTPPLSYQWSFGTTNLAGATNATLTLTNVQLTLAGNYSVLVSNLYGATNSEDAVLTVNPAPPCDPPPSGLISWWRGEGNTDDSIGTNNGTPVGNLGYTNGEVGQGFVFDHSTNYIWVAASPSLDFGTNGGVTMECWRKPNAITVNVSGGPIMEWDSASAAGLQLWEGNGGLFAIFVDTSGNQNTIVTNNSILLDTNNFHHVAATYDRSSGLAVLYLDGVVIATNNFGSITLQTSYPDYHLNIGGRTGEPIGNGNTYGGVLDELSVYNRALSASEIQAIYGAGSGGKCFTPVSPAITAQPTNQTVNAGSLATFTVTAGGTPPLSYQWSFDNTNIAGATSAALTLADVQPANAGAYAVTVSNAFGTIASSNAVLTVLVFPPTITTQPTNQTVNAGKAAIFAVAAGGTPPLSYQWSFGTTNLAGATNATLTLTNVQLTQAGNYSVLVTNLYGSTNSAVAVLTVNPAPPCDPPPSGLVSWWRAEGNANDVISGNNGVGIGGVSYASGEVGLAFDFDGTSGYVNVPSSPNLEFTNAFTVEGWINLNTAPGSGTLTIAAKGLDSNAGMDWMLSVGHGQLETAATVGGSQQGGYCATTLVAGAWYHVAMSFDGSNLRGYVNGALDGTFAVSGTARTTTNALRIGAYAPVNGTGGNKAFFPGKVDELSVYNQTLSASEIQAIYTAGTGGKCFTPVPPTLTTQPTNQTVYAGNTVIFTVVAAGTPPLSYQWSIGTTNLGGATNATLTLTNVQLTQAGNYSVLVSNLYGATNSATALLTVNPAPPCDPPPSGLVSWWRAEGNANDFIGGNNGAVTGGVSYASGEVGLAFEFDGTSGYVNVPSSPNLMFSNAFTVEGWINLNTVPAGTVTVAAKGLDSNAGMDWMLSVANGQLEAAATVGGSQQGGYCATTLVAGAWYHVAMSFDGSNLRGYVNGALDGTFAVSGTLRATTNALRIGAYAPVNGTGGNKAFFPGKVDELSVYNQTLSASEIQAIYTAGTGGKCVPTAPFVSTQPANQSVAVGSTAMFAVVAGGTTPLSYQWRFNGTNLSGATNFVLTLPNVQLTNAGNYSVSVTNLLGSVTSSNALLTVLTVPVITQPPASSTNVAGNTASFAAVASGSLPLSYQWQKNGVPLNNGGKISGATTNGLTITNVQDADAASYVLVVTNMAGSVTSAPAMLVVLDPPTITQPPANSTNVAGSTASFVAVASGSPPLIYQWQKSGAPLLNGGKVAGATTADLTLTNVQDADAAIYALVVTNVVGSVTSAPAMLVVLDPPAITLQPTNQFVQARSNAVLVAAASGTGPLGCQWSCNGTNLWNSSRITGSQSSVLVISNAMVRDSGNYQVVFTNSLGSATSSVAVLAVGLPPQITTEPASHSAPLGCTVGFSVGAAGSQPLAEQWWKDGSLLDAQTNATLTVSNFQSADLGGYSVVVTNWFGCVTSVPAVLSVGYHPPVAGLDVVQRFAAGGVRISTADLLANDVDTNGDSLTIIGVSSNSAAGGSVGLANNWVYYAPPAGWTNSDSFTYTVSDGLCETDEGTVLVEVTADNPQPAHFGIGAQANGPMQLSFTGIPGNQYQIQYADSLVNPNWQVLTTQPADSYGVCQFTDWSPTNTTVRYYRALQVLVLPFGSR